MAWQRKERKETIETILRMIREQGPKPYIEMEKMIMKMHLLSRLTANRYLEDLIYEGDLTLTNKDMLEIPKPKSEPDKEGRKR